MQRTQPMKRTQPTPHTQPTPRTQLGPHTRLMPRPPVSDRTDTADLRVVVRSGNPLVVEICGEIDIQSAPALRDELLQVIRHYGPQLALDVSGVTFMDCAGINVLLATRRRAQLEDGSVRVIRASPRVRRMISLLGLGRAFELG
jgi:anti-sigma B factor antagonist